ncbi:hypothetical protein Bbelb_102200 [Branchiostoma belcheri]|nr:hypothetical protein Bbelb_102200 [Branchiostoma belcheri]
MVTKQIYNAVSKPEFSTSPSHIGNGSVTTTQKRLLWSSAVLQRPPEFLKTAACLRRLPVEAHWGRVYEQLNAMEHTSDLRTQDAVEFKGTACWNTRPHAGPYTTGSDRLGLCESLFP